MGILKQLSQYTDLITPKEFLQDYSKIVFLLVVSSKFFVSNILLLPVTSIGVIFSKETSGSI